MKAFLIMRDGGEAVCHGCGCPHDDVFSRFCRRCRGARLATFIKAHRVEIPAGDENRPVVRKVAHADR